MIILDTHIWLWWVNEDIDHIGQGRNILIQHADIVSVSAISCFEVAWLDAHGRIQLPCSRTNWFEKALEGLDAQFDMKGNVIKGYLPAKAVK